MLQLVRAAYLSDFRTRAKTTTWIEAMVLTVESLRALFRNLEAFRSVFETEGVDTITGPDGDEINLWDLEYLYDQVPRLPERQRQAIQYFLVANLREEDVAEMMGIARSNPIGLCATNGLKNLMKMVSRGELDRSFEVEQPA